MTDIGLSSRERTTLALRRQTPDRTPLWWSFGPQPPARQALDAALAPHGLTFDAYRAATRDALRANPAYVGPPLPSNASYWGWTTKPMSYGAGAYDEFDHQPLAHIDSLDELVAYDWPDPDVLDAQAAVDAVRRADPEHRLFRVAWGGNPMETLTWMMGLEKLMMLLAIEPRIILEGLERVVGFYETVMRRMLEAGPGEFDAVFAADDLGGQSGPLISPAMYRELIQPYHRRIYAAAHEYVEFTLHHSDGSVFALLDDLLDAGVDALEATQTDCAGMDPAHLADHYGERMSFVGGVSVQQLLPHGSVEEVEREVGRLIETLGAGGGLVAGPSHAIQAGTPPENVFAMVRTITGRTVEEIAATPRETT